MSPPTLEVIRHPLVEHKLSHLRDRRTGGRRFKALLEEVTLLMTVHATRDLVGEPVTFDTPLATTRARRVQEDRLVVVPILRAGLGMVEGVLGLIGGARVGHLGFFRDEESLEPVRYYGRLPPDPGRRVFLLVDPMLATGGTATAAAGELKACGGRDIRFLCLVAAPEGAARMAEEHPDVPVYAAALDRRLDERGYIVPGLGDAGDRLFGTL